MTPGPPGAILTYRFTHEKPGRTKYISTSHRSAPRERIAEDLSLALDERAANPDLIIGFDLVEEEDEGHTNLFYIDEFLKARREAEQRNITMPLYIHSGESN